MRRRWECSRCGRTLRARVEVRMLFHECRIRHLPREVMALPEVEYVTVEEIRAAAWRNAFSRALHDDTAMLRRL